MLACNLLRLASTLGSFFKESADFFFVANMVKYGSQPKMNNVA